MHGQFSVPADGPSAGAVPSAEGPSLSLGERVALLRRRRGLSQVELSNLIGRSESWVSQVERGARHLDRLSVLRKVADALEVSVADLQPTAVDTVEAAGDAPGTAGAVA
jgi:transcriptional regulator with XRE-family HTH domain